MNVNDPEAVGLLFEWVNTIKIICIYLRFFFRNQIKEAQKVFDENNVEPADLGDYINNIYAKRTNDAKDVI